MAKIANPDRTVMDRLYAGEVNKLARGSKMAAKMAAEKAPGFADHAEFEKTLNEILTSDSTSDGTDKDLFILD
jgi:hypothetical protein